MVIRKVIYIYGFDIELCEGGRELFEVCRNGDVIKVRWIVNVYLNVNFRDIVGRKLFLFYFVVGESCLNENKCGMSYVINIF